MSTPTRVVTISNFQLKQGIVSRGDEDNRLHSWSENLLENEMYLFGIFDMRGCKDKESCYKLHLSVTKKRGRMFIFNDVYGLCLSNASIRGQSYFQ